MPSLSPNSNPSTSPTASLFIHSPLSFSGALSQLDTTPLRLSSPESNCLIWNHPLTHSLALTFPHTSAICGKKGHGFNFRRRSRLSGERHPLQLTSTHSSDTHKSTNAHTHTQSRTHTNNPDTTKTYLMEEDAHVRRDQHCLL